MPARRKPEHKRGRPKTLHMPAPIPDTPEKVAKALLRTPRKREDEWEYLNADRRDMTAGRENASMGGKARREKVKART